MTSFISRLWPALLLTILSAAPLSAAEFFVNTKGDDAHDGLSRAAAFATLQKGVDALQPGDTLIIGPGEYAQSVRRDKLGADTATTTIRAEIPGTVLLRGDVPVPSFVKVEGRRFVYATDFDATVLGDPQTVLEHDTRNLLDYTPDPSELEFIPGMFCYDATLKKLYISTSNMSAPDGRCYTVSTGRVSGIYLGAPRRVTIEGLSVTGFYRLGAERFPPCLWGIPWGIALADPTDCVVRNCTSYLNAGGIALDHGHRNLVEDCVAFGNRSRYEPLSGNIMNFGGLGKEGTGETLIRNCLAFDGGCGIHQYGRMFGPVVLRGNMAWGNQGSNLHIKTGLDEDNRAFGLVENSVALGGMGGVTTRHNLVVGRPQHECRDRTDIRSEEHKDFDLDRHFADPDNLDFRLQSDSPFRGASADGTDQGPNAYQANVFYVRAEGDDQANGLSMRTAWRTLDRAVSDLRPGDTLYIDAGAYPSQLTIKQSLGSAGDAVQIRGRGRKPVIIQGGLSVAGGGALLIDRLTFAGPVELHDGRHVTLNNCIFRGAVEAKSVSALRATHNLFAAPLTLQKCSEVFLSGNIHANANAAALVLDDLTAVRYSDYNGYQNAVNCWSVAGKSMSLADVQKQHDSNVQILKTPVNTETGTSVDGFGPRGSALGIHHDYRTQKTEVRLIGPFIHSVTDTTANIEWWTTGPTGLRVQWGDTKEMTNAAPVQAHRYGTFSLTGLKPGVKYYFKLVVDALPEANATLTFTTGAAVAQAKTYYVAPDGNDARTGLTRADAWRSVNHAADTARPGDIVLLAGGKYRESVRIRTTGEAGRPISFQPIPGERVNFDGVNQSLSFAFYLAKKHHVHIDGIYFTRFNGYENYVLPWSDQTPGNGDSGAFSLYRSDHVTISRCFNDGRGGGYAPGLVLAAHCSDLRVQNCVNTVTMGGLVTFFGCPDLRIEHNVSVGNFIYNIVGVNDPYQKVHFLNNVFTDNCLMTKVGAPFFELGKVESLVEKDNCYYTRTPDDVKQPFFFYDPPAYNRAAVGFGMTTDFPSPPAITELTRLSLAEYQKRFNPDSGSFIANPGFAGAQNANPLNKDGTPQLMSDYLVAKTDLDFPDLFATNAQLTSRDIGLQPKAFADFHFSRGSAALQ